MKVNHVDNTHFGMKFTPNEGLEKLLHYTAQKIDNKTVRLSRRLARKYKGQEVSIENFQVINEANRNRFKFDLKNLSSGTIYKKEYFGINNWCFNINKFLRDCIKSKGLFYLDANDKVEHNLTGTKKLLRNLLG